MWPFEDQRGNAAKKTEAQWRFQSPIRFIVYITVSSSLNQGRKLAVVLLKIPLVVVRAGKNKTQTKKDIIILPPTLTHPPSKGVPGTHAVDGGALRRVNDHALVVARPHRWLYGRG
mmetsp:Transcript_43516/g.59432  ORF Transcript_43516/g.59432 Transcript_43516/m.59432 type:complete len:116 (-) Transcript_43516:314-661(-)